MSAYLTQVMDELRKGEHLGVKKLQNGVELIGKIPHGGPGAYLHIVFPGLHGSQINTIEKQISCVLPESLKSFYKKTNGVHLYGGSLSIYGLKTSYNRTGDDSYRPFCIGLSNVDERPSDAEDSLVFFGFYDTDLGDTHFNLKNSHVARLNKRFG